MTSTPLLDDSLLDELMAVAQEVALACGALVVDERPHDLGVAATKSTAIDVVTVMDQRSESLAHDLLRARRPHDGLYGEEGLNVQGSSGITWVVDPIDGTVNYLYELPVFAVSVAAVIGDPRKDGEWFPIAGAVFNPALGELFAARKGGGATAELCGDPVTRLSTPSCPPLSQALVATGFGYESTVRARQGKILAQVLPHVRDIRRLGAASLDICYAALGRVNAYYEEGPNPWDIAAGWVIAEEAGLVVKGFATTRPTRALTLVGPPGLVEDLEKALTDAGFEQPR